MLNKRRERERERERRHDERNSFMLYKILYNVMSLKHGIAYPRLSILLVYLPLEQRRIRSADFII